MNAQQQEIPSVLVPAMVLEPGAWTSLYLKVLPVDLTINGNDISDEASLTELIECGLQLGKVERIDFSHRKTSTGAVLKSAYIHFFLWNSACGAYCRNTIDNHGSVSYAGITDMHGTVHPFMGKWYNGVSKKRFLTFKKNTNPISSTNLNEMNHAQLLRKCQQMEEHNQSLHNKVQEFIKKERSDLLKAAQIWKALVQPNVVTPTRLGADDDKMSISELDLDEDDTVGRTEQWRIDDDEDEGDVYVDEYANRNLGNEMDIEDGELVE